MLAFLAALCFAIAALIAFTSLNGISVIGLIALGLTLWAVNYGFANPGAPWARRGPP
jgi:hypothetical protein